MANNSLAMLNKLINSTSSIMEELRASNAHCLASWKGATRARVGVIYGRSHVALSLTSRPHRDPPVRYFTANTDPPLQHRLEDLPAPTTMSLSRLPSEILLHILSCLGSSFFAHDLRRLSISRTWYTFAWTILHRDLRFTANSLARFTDNEAVLKRSPPYIITVELFLGIGDEFSQSLPTEDLREASGINARDVDASPGQLDLSLAKLADIIPRCSGLRSLSVQARGQNSPLRPDGLPFLNTRPLVGLLSPPHLTSLQFDTAGCYVRSPPGSHVHICRSINSLLPSLRRLRCRMEDICETLLERPPSDTAIEEVIINLSISQLFDTTTSYRYPNRCQTIARDFPALKLALETQATTLVARLRNPRIFRIISHELPSLGVYAFDAIKGRRFRLESNVDWDADGEIVDEVLEEDESDLFDSDSPVAPQIVW